jgi:hypothetical protein
VLVRERQEVQEVPRALAFLGTALIACTTANTAPSASPTLPTASAPAVSASASPSASAAGVLDDRFGFVVSDTNGNATVRSETSDQQVMTFMPQGRSWTSLSQTVSPDGRNIAYWAQVNDGPVLHVRPTDGSAHRVVFTGAKGMYGNAFAWSSDGTGLAVAIDNGCQEICGQQGGQPVAELWTVDLATKASEKVASGYYWIPVTWDRAANLIAAGVTGPGGYLTGYHVVDVRQKPAVLRATAFNPTVLGRLKASSDARFVLLSVDLGTSTTLSWWPLAEPQKRQDIGQGGATAEWRPGTSEIWWVGGLSPPGCRVSPCSGTELSAFDVLTGATRTLRGQFGATITGFRVDGSAAMTWQRGGPESILVVDLRAGQTARLPIGGPFVRLR